MKSPTSLVRRFAGLALAVPFATLLLAPPLDAQPDNAAAAAGRPPLEDLAAFPRTTLEIVSGARRHRFDVWVADTEARKEQGLMFVRDLPQNEGMLFPDCCSGIWMKNTYIELDIVFVGKDGRIAKIAPRARPFDETTIPAPGPVEAVVELKGGEAQELGLKVGDKIIWNSSAKQSRARG